MTKVILLLSLLSLSLPALANAKTSGTITCTLEAIVDASGANRAKTVLIASNTQPASPYGATLSAQSVDGQMSFDVSLGRLTSVIISDHQTKQISSSYFKGAVFANGGVLVQLNVQNTSKGNVFLNCLKDD